ncbi:LysR family transcriptional regulator [Hephaestia sp. GCM10023244]|uniref:LysR family transcriptional regulator n=1 Tax=unclassified Hephaestia TaxID=2631281 RepID=UPI0020778F85|nr:LysR family transcriptional regulator [Hephaestia sp. MAHUQ-44]MCM8730137.1 LysR family transcriptional regulator [Hephaestia sp. MAHUQ-44]
MSEIDLNLLRVFDTLFELGNVTKAGARLGLTQSAVSHALGRLRQSVGDPLFVRAPGGLQPTARAIEIAPGVRMGLSQLRTALSPSAFDPGTAHRRFTIAAGSYFCALLIPRLLAHARQVAPHVSFRVQPLGGDLLVDLDEGAVDVALGAFTKIPKRLRVEPLFQEELVWIAAGRNALVGRRLTPADLAEQPRVVIATGKPFEALRLLTSEGGLERRTIIDTNDPPNGTTTEPPISVYDARTALAVVGRTDCIALVPKRFAQQDGARLGVAILDVPDSGDEIGLTTLWHSKFEEDAGVRWLRETISALI